VLYTRKQFEKGRFGGKIIEKEMWRRNWVNRFVTLDAPMAGDPDEGNGKEDGR